MIEHRSGYAGELLYLCAMRSPFLLWQPSRGFFGCFLAGFVCSLSMLSMAAPSAKSSKEHCTRCHALQCLDLHVENNCVLTPVGNWRIVRPCDDAYLALFHYLVLVTIKMWLRKFNAVAILGVALSAFE